MLTSCNARVVFGSLKEDDITLENVNSMFICLVMLETQV